MEDPKNEEAVGTIPTPVDADPSTTTKPELPLDGCTQEGDSNGDVEETEDESEESNEGDSEKSV